MLLQQIHKQDQVQEHKNVLSQRAIITLTNRWDKVNSSPFAYIPNERKGKVTLREAFLQNKLLGEFASSYVRKLLSRASYNQKLDHWTNQKSFLFAGFGKGYDSNFVSEANKAGLRIVCIDVSSVACREAKVFFEKEWGNFSAEALVQKPLVIQGEIRTTLLAPHLVDLEIFSTKVFYFCRTLTCLSKRSAKIVLENIGKLFSETCDPKKEKRLVIISAMKDHNPNRVGKASKLYFLNEILAFFKKGAGRVVEATDEETHRYFDQVYSAVTIKCT